MIRAKLGLLELAQQFGDVPEACRVPGCSRDSFRRFRDLCERGGGLALAEMTKAKPNLRNRVAPEFEAAVAAIAVAQDTFRVGTPKGVGRVYQQTAIDTSSKVGFAKLTDRGTEHCGAHDRHECELCLAVEDIDHPRTRTKSRRTDGICGRFHRRLLDEFCRAAFRKKVCRAIEELRADLDEWRRHHNQARPHQGRWCFGETPMQPFLDSRPLARGKQQIGEAA